jgi:hypothetical protein
MDIAINNKLEQKCLEKDFSNSKKILLFLKTVTYHEEN